MSWESSQIYYKIINEKVREILGGFNSASCLMESVNFAEIESLMQKDDWKSLNAQMVKAVKNLEAGGAELFILCTNSMHLCADAMIANTQIPFIHIADATAQQVKIAGLKKVLLLGTRFTMTRDFYKDKLLNDHGIEVMIPNPKDAKLVDQIIFNEMVHGKFLTESKAIFQGIIEKAASQGAEGVILGCTEIPMLISEDDVSIPTFDTTRIHAEAAVELALR